MFELMSDVHSAPVEGDALVRVHRGMNKVRVSVVGHSSEPSEVFIITGRSDGNLETYIIFYMLEPGIHVVYGCESNPFPQEQLEAVTDEAVAFVEEMGSILEEVPWETMSADQRSAWLQKEALYSVPVIEDLEQIEEAEAEPVEVPPDEDEQEIPEEFVQVGEEEIREILDEDAPVEEAAGTGVEEDAQEENASGAGGPGQFDAVDADADEVVVAEGSFDELLKQAFLKPEVVAKTGAGGRGKDGSRAEAEPDETVGGAAQVPETDATRGSAGSVTTEEGPSLDDRIDFLAGSGDAGPRGKDAPSAAAGTGPGEGEARLKVIRFLSRF